MIGYTLENFPFAAYHDIDVKETLELPSKHHYFLLQPIVPGFALYDKTWSKSPVVLSILRSHFQPIEHDIYLRDPAVLAHMFKYVDSFYQNYSMSKALRNSSLTPAWRA